MADGEKTNALREGEHINRAILDSLVAQIAVLDRDGSIVTVNQAWGQFGRENMRDDGAPNSPDAFAGVNYLDACKNAVNDPDAQKAFHGIRAVLDGNEPQFMLEYPCHSPHEQRWFLLLVTPLAHKELAHEEYSLSGAVVTHQDISERRRAEIERAKILEREYQAREIAEAANRAKDEFLAVVSHELRTPLHSILGWVQLLRELEHDDPARQQAMDIIERNVRTQSHLINDLLDVSRIASGKISLVPIPLELQAVAQGAIEMVASQALKKQIAITTEFLANPRVMGDEQRLQQAIWNLIQNAIKFSPEGEEIRVRLEEAEGRARLSVIDNGIGIAEEFLPRVFERFQQADGTSTRRHSGLGLGLAITSHLIELHEGTIAAFSDGVGKGASFVVELPLLDKSSLTEPA